MFLKQLENYALLWTNSELFQCILKYPLHAREGGGALTPPPSLLLFLHFTKKNLNATQLFVADAIANSKKNNPKIWFYHLLTDFCLRSAKSPMHLRVKVIDSFTHFVAIVWRKDFLSNLLEASKLLNISWNIKHEQKMLANTVLNASCPPSYIEDIEKKSSLILT